MMPGTPWGATQSTLTSSRGASTVWPSHSLTRCGSPAISRQAREKSPVPPALGWSAGGALPLHEERQLRVGDQAVDADLPPLQLGPVGAVPVAGRRLTAEASLDLGDVVDRDDPPEPAATQGGAGADGLAERRLVGGGMVENLDDLEVGRVGQREDHVASAETRVDAPVGEVLPQQATDPPRRGREAIGCGGVREMVQTHVKHSGLRRLETTHWGTGFLTSRFLTRPVACVAVGVGRPSDRSQAGSAGCRPSGDRDRTWASACSTSAAYPAVPISSVSSAALVT